MLCDELDATARLRHRFRTLIADLHDLGVPVKAMRDKNLLELEQMKERALSRCMGAPRR